MELLRLNNVVSQALTGDKACDRITKAALIASIAESIVVRKVALDLVGHHLLDCLLDAMYDHFVSYLLQRVWFQNLLHPHHLVKPCRFIEASSM